MFTRNYWIYKSAEFANKTSEIDGSSIRPIYTTVTGTVASHAIKSGNSYYCNAPTDAVIRGALNKPVNTDYVSTTIEPINKNSYNFSSGVFFGSGTAPATIDDYKLEGTIATGFTYSAVDLSERSDDGIYSIIGKTYTITNNNDTDIVIGEIGIFFECWWTVSNYSSGNNHVHYPYLCERTVLESPITIPANGGVGQVTYKIRMDYPVPAATE